MPEKENGHGKTKYRTHSCACKNASLIAQFVPARKEDLRSAWLRNTIIGGWGDAEYPFILFRISNKSRKTTQIILDDQCLGRMIDMLDYEAEGVWINSAASYFQAKEDRRLTKKYMDAMRETDISGIFQIDDPEYRREWREVERRYRDRRWIIQSCEPLGIAEFSTDIYPGAQDVKGKAGATMTIYYQPNQRPHEKSEKPWIIEITQYELCRLQNEELERRNVRSNRVKISTGQFNDIVNEIVRDMTKWERENNMGL